MTAPEEPLVLTVDEAAVLLRVSRGLAFAAVRAGTLPHLRIGRRILIPRLALYELLEAAGSSVPGVGLSSPGSASAPEAESGDDKSAAGCSNGRPSTARQGGTRRQGAAH